MLCEVYNRLNRLSFVSFRDAWIGTVVDGLTSFYAGFVVFSILGFMANDVGLTMEEISKLATGNNDIMQRVLLRENNLH